MFNDNKNIKTYQASSIEDIYCALDSITNSIQGNQVLWFHGQRKNIYDVIPSAFFSEPIGDHSMSSYDQAVRRQQQEELRYMNFRAKSSHYSVQAPDGMIAWLELMQNHGGHTRMLDWSESLRVSLGIALKPFLTPDGGIEMALKRETATPVLWVLNPTKLNEHVYDFLSKEPIEEIENVIRNFFPTNQETTDAADRILNELQKKELYFPKLNSASSGNNIGIQGIISLSTLSDLRKERGTELKNLFSRKTFNPFYFLALCYYEESFPYEIKNEANILPPLATLQPYSNDNIKLRRSAFTIFPNYCLSQAMQDKKRLMNVDMKALNNQESGLDCLFRIQLLRPGHIASQLIKAGDRLFDLYPQLDKVVDVLEAQNYYF